MIVKEDLKALNQRILAHLCTPNVNLDRALGFLSVCLGRLKPTGQEIVEGSNLKAAANDNSLDVISINKEYLTFARQVARDITSGYFDGLLVLGIDLSQARSLARLSNQQIHDLARFYPGTVFEVAGLAQRPVAEFHSAAVPHYSAALLAA